MEKLYSEDIYNQYLELLIKIENGSDPDESSCSYVDLKYFLSDNNVSEEAVLQMDMRRVESWFDNR